MYLCRPRRSSPRGRPFWDLYTDDQIDLPTVAPMPFAELDPHSLRLQEMCGNEDGGYTEAELRRARRGCNSAVSYVDHLLGWVLNTLCSAPPSCRTTWNVSS